MREQNMPGPFLSQDPIKLKPPAGHWSTTAPRAWQAAALPIALDALVTEERGVIRAVMGAGKSILQAEIIAQLDLPADVVVVVSVPSLQLVTQLASTIEARLGCAVRQYSSEAPRRRDMRPYAVNVACNLSMPSFAASVPEGTRVIWIADEAHKTEARVILDAVREIDPIARLGFTATPWRAKEGESLSAFERMIFNYGPADGIADGVVVPVSRISLKAWEGLPVDDMTIAVALSETSGGIVNATGIPDAVAFAQRLTDAGVSCGVIHSELPNGEAARIIAGSKSGEIKVMVHVNMLAEGVDMPWLRWMVARRRVQSPVRFPQEVGRILRAFPGKSSARLYDPHDLWGTLSLSLDAVLGGTSVLDKDEPEPSDEEPEHREPKAREVRRVVEMTQMAALITEMRAHFDQNYDLVFCHRREGFDPATGEKYGSRFDEPATASQVHYLRATLVETGIRVPERLRQPLRDFYATGEGVDKGYASDLLTALLFLKKHPNVTWS